MDIKTAREILGEEYNDLTDEQLQEALVLLTAIINRVVDKFLSTNENINAK